MTTIILIFAALFGASVGSFLNVCIFRLPRRCLRLWKPKLSFCPGCHRTLEAWENVPVFGYVFLGGKCRGCKVPIPFRYFLVELTTALLFLYLANVHLLGEERHLGLFLVHATFGAALIVCGLVDWDHRVIPDEIDIPGYLLAPLIAAFVPEMFGDRIIPVARVASNLGILLDSALPWWGLSDGAAHALTSPLHGLYHLLAHKPHELAISAAFTSVVGAMAGGALIWTIGWLGDKAFQRAEGAMGFGDVKFMAMIGGFLGWQGILSTIVVASVLGSIWGIGHKVRSGTTTVKGEDVVYATPLSYLALRLFGAPSRQGYRQIRALLKAKEPFTLKKGGGLAARFATGDSYLPFGPFLALGAGIYAYWPNVIEDTYFKFGELVAKALRPS